MSEINFQKNLLLTGAGFTANFGGLLAREMWSKILSHKEIENIPKVKTLLLGNFDFEAVYSEVANKTRFDDREREIFQKIVSDSYADMDDTLRNGSVGGFAEYGIFWHWIATLVHKFDGTQGTPGAIFTLNQDLAMERMKTFAPPLGITAVKYREHWDSHFAGQIDLKKPITLPTDTELQEFFEKHLSSCGVPYYIKLHGSQGWLSSDSKNQLVLGTNKYEDIQKEPLLKWYFQLFEKALYRKEVKLFVIGYSFNDAHVNSCILKAVQEYALKIYVISPEDPERLKWRLEGRLPGDPQAAFSQSDNIKIWEAISGYFPYKLKDIFPRGDVPSHIYKNIERLLT